MKYRIGNVKIDTLIIATVFKIEGDDSQIILVVLPI